MAATVIYHARCPDGLGAAWAANHALAADGVEDVVYHAGYYGADPPWPLIDGREVYIVDFSYRRAVLLEIFERADGLKVFDHHKTAAEDLQDLPFCVFDMGRSGAGITWDEMNPGKPRPWVIDYIEDRDLWRFNLPHSRVVSDYLGCLEEDFAALDQAATVSVEDVVELGVGARMKIDAYCRNMEANVQYLTVDGYQGVPVVNAPQIMISDLLNHLCNLSLERDPGAPGFAVGYWVRHDGKTQHSLRSVGDFDVSAIAQRYGGGGHQNAAGFVAHDPRW